MNYYERHIGDYLKDTAHLTLLEHGVYTRLLDVYYTREDGIPEADAGRLVGARLPAEKQALRSVLSEFFALRDGLWRQRRADAEIERLQCKRAKASASARARWAQGERNAKAHADDMRTHMRSHSERNANAMHARPSPVTNHQSPNTAKTRTATSPEVARVGQTQSSPDSRKPPDPDGGTGAAPAPTPPPAAPPSAAASACMAMRAAGIADANPGHPDLLALLDAGATEAEFVGAATTAAGRGKGFAYAVGMLRQQRTDAAKTAAGLHRGPMPQRSNGHAPEPAWRAEQRARWVAFAGPAASPEARAAVAAATAAAPPLPATIDLEEPHHAPAAKLG